MDDDEQVLAVLKSQILVQSLAYSPQTLQQMPLPFPLPWLLSFQDISLVFFCSSNRLKILARQMSFLVPFLDLPAYRSHIHHYDGWHER